MPEYLSILDDIDPMFMAPAQVPADNNYLLLGTYLRRARCGRVELVSLWGLADWPDVDNGAN